MPFETGYKFLRTYVDNREDQMRNRKKMDWSTTPVSSYDEMITQTFDSTPEDEEWFGLYNAELPDLNKIIGVRGKIAWLCGNRRDMRKQFACDGGTRARVMLDHWRFELLRLKWFYKGMARMHDILVKERQEIT